MDKQKQQKSTGCVFRSASDNFESSWWSAISNWQFNTSSTWTVMLVTTVWQWPSLLAWPLQFLVLNCKCPKLLPVLRKTHSGLFCHFHLSIGVLVVLHWPKWWFWGLFFQLINTGVIFLCSCAEHLGSIEYILNILNFIGYMEYWMSHDENAFQTQSLHVSQKGSLANLFENSNNYINIFLPEILRKYFK